MMEWLNWKIVLGVAIPVMLILAWLLWKFSLRLFKVFLVLIAIQLAIGGYVYFRTYRPTKNPAIGRHAYLKENGKYLGIVEGAGEDNARGEVWIVRPPGRYPLMYSKSRVLLKDRREIENEPQPSPSPRR